MPARILIVDDEPKIRTILSTILANEGYTVKTAENGEEGLAVVDGFDPQLILMDQNMPGMDGIQTMARMRDREPGRTIIILTAFGSIPLAVEAMKMGAYDYIAKPFDNEELLLVIRRALERSRLAEEVSSLRKELREQYRFENIIGVSPKMQRLFEQMRRVCDTGATVFIQGESGTGKELVAKAIHYCSTRKDRQLISVNCGAIPVSLIESEFFGHEKGAFTDARERKAGKLELADGGTLFLDEIGEFPHDAQVKLLRVLEDKVVTPIGGSKAVPVDVRIIAATNKNLEEEVAKGNFRLDLFYRLNIFPMTVPPLRERSTDIPLLAEHFLEKHNRLLGLKVHTISRAAIQSMEEYSWPGNVRELENAIQSAMILTRGEVILLEDLPLRLRGYPEVPGESVSELSDMGLENYVRTFSARMERDLLVRTLSASGGSRSLTAEKLGISRKTLFNKMKQYGIG
jgi:DNA-binding NtrC family response regulator